MKKIILPFILFSFLIFFVQTTQALNLKRYFVVKVLDTSDNIIVEDSYGDQYVVEYGIGCLSMWRYEDKYIYIDIGGSFLDGIGDTIQLLDSDDECRVWDVEELESSNSSYYYIPTPPPSYTPPPTKYCPLNSYLSTDDKCHCNSGYVVLNNSCVTYTQACQNLYGINSYGDKDYCYCNMDYSFDENKICVKNNIEVPINTKPSFENKIVIDKDEVSNKKDPISEENSSLEDKESTSTNITENKNINTKSTNSIFKKETLWNKLVNWIKSLFSNID